MGSTLARGHVVGTLRPLQSYDLISTGYRYTVSRVTPSNVLYSIYSINRSPPPEASLYLMFRSKKIHCADIIAREHPGTGPSQTEKEKVASKQLLLEGLVGQKKRRRRTPTREKFRRRPGSPGGIHLLPWCCAGVDRKIRSGIERSKAKANAPNAAIPPPLPPPRVLGERPRRAPVCVAAAAAAAAAAAMPER